MKTNFSDSPLVPSFERMAKMKDALYLFARLGVSDDEGWVSMSRLTDDGELVGEQLRTMKEKWGVDNRSAAIGVVGGLAWQVGGAALFLYAADKRVPDLSPENVMLHLTDDGLAEVAFVSGRFAALSSDAEAGSADVLFGDEDGLRGHLREGIEGMVEPVVSHARASMRVSKRTMWNRGLGSHRTKAPSARGSRRRGQRVVRAGGGEAREIVRLAARRGDAVFHRGVWRT